MIIRLPLLSLVVLALAQDSALVTHPKPVDVTVTEYNIVAFNMTLPSREIPNSSPPQATEWSFSISYDNNLGVLLTDRHYGVMTDKNPNGADVYLKALMSADLSKTSLTAHLLTHLIAEGKIPRATIAPRRPPVTK